MGQQVRENLVLEREEKLFFYSPYHFLRQLDQEKQQKLFGTGLALSYDTQAGHQIFEFKSEGIAVQFLFTLLSWDTAFFQTPVYKVFTVLFSTETPFTILSTASKAFRQHLAQIGAAYCFIELPIEDTKVVQAFCSAEWKLVETRLNFYREGVTEFNHSRYPVRLATPSEAENIGGISGSARNEYDRFHADPWFGDQRADAFLHKYASAAVEGYCDAVLVPAETGLQTDSFLAINDLNELRLDLNLQASRIVLTAVGPANRGWHLKLVAETVQRAKEKGDQYVVMTTQATNKAVFRTCEKLGFKLGSTTCVLSYSL